MAGMEAAAPVRCPLLVGREGEIEVLTSALRQVTRGKGSAVFMFGEAGSGKTRLLRHLIAATRAQGTTVLEGAASPLGGTPPYATIAQAFRSSLRWRELPVDELLPYATGLRLVLPEWPAPQAAVDLDSGQRRLLAMESAVQLLARLGAAGGCLVALEDVHWADTDSLETLGHCAAALPDVPALIVATLRLAESHDVEAALEAMAARGQGTVMLLRRLGLDGVRAMAEAIVQTRVDEGFVTRLYERSQGSPLLVEELLAVELGGDTGSGATSDVHSVPSAFTGSPVSRAMASLVAEKLERVSDDSRQVIAAAAVTEDLDVGLLALMTGIDEQRIEAALHEGVRVGLLEMVAGALTFRHVLVADSVVTTLLESERHRLHRDAARALEARHQEEPAFAERRGIHLLRAGRPEEAWQLLLVAGRWKLTSGSAEAAEQTLRIALGAAPNPDSRNECRTLLAAALAEVGRWDDAIAVDAEAEDDHSAERLLRMARSAARCGRVDQADDLLTRAAALGAPEAAVLALQSLLSLWRGRLEEARQSAMRAAVVAEVHGNQATLCEALDVAGRAADALGKRGEAAATFDRWAEVATSAGLAMGRVQAKMERGNLDFMSGGEDAGLRTARALAIDAGAYASQALADISLTWWLGQRARLHEALESADEAVELCRRFHLDVDHYAAVAAGWVRSRLDPLHGDELLGQALAVTPGDVDVEILVAWTRGDAALRREEAPRAIEEYWHAAALMSANPSAVPPPVPYMLVCALALTGRVDEAEIALAGARRSPALPRLYVNPQWLAVAEALLAKSAADLAAAAELMRANSDYNRAIALMLGSAVIGGEPARTWLPEALLILQTAGAETDAARCRRLMRRASIPVPRRRVSVSPMQGGIDQLTPREAEILELVGRGFTNPEIAARLFLSVRTVESHVAALLRKHDVAGRPALIALAARSAQSAAIPG